MAEEWRELPILVIPSSPGIRSCSRSLSPQPWGEHSSDGAVGISSPSIFCSGGMQRSQRQDVAGLHHERTEK